MLTVVQSRRVARQLFSTATISLSLAIACCSSHMAPFPTPPDPNSPPPFSTVVSISPDNVRVSPGGTQTFTATVTGVTDTAVTFGVVEGDSGGKITNAGVYTAPPTLGTYHVTAISVADTSAFADATTLVWPSGIATTPTGNMHATRDSYTATLLGNGKVLVAGGDSDIGGITSAELYDPLTGTFASTGPTKSPRYAHTATLLMDGKVLVTGGLGDGDNQGSASTSPSVLGSAELYDPATGKFAATGTMVVPRANHTATLLASGKVLIVGGIGDIGTSDGRFPYSGDGLVTAEIYDPATGVFTATGSMTMGRYAHTATPLVSGLVLISGGITSVNSTGDATATSTAELYDPTTESFASTAGPMHAARERHTATLLSSGKVLLTGGIDASAELFDPSTAMFSSTGNMHMARSAHTATLITGPGAADEVLVTGGVDVYNHAIVTMELYSQVTGTFAANGTMQAARTSHTATLLQSSNILLAGGERELTSELYP